MNFLNLIPAKVLLSLASPYLAGKDANECFCLAQDLYNAHKFTSTLDILGEASQTVKDCQSYFEKFINLINLVSATPLPDTDMRKQFTISFKPSMFCVSNAIDTLPTQNSYEAGYAMIERIVQYAHKRNVSMTLEAEDHRWADFQLDSYFSLLNAGYDNLGTVLQTRLFRTEKDIRRFDQRGRVRLVIGIYEESREFAYRDKKQMKDLLITYSRMLFEKGAYIELASHDQHYIDKFFADMALPLRIDPSKFEIQFLLGVPRSKLQKMLTSGEYFERWKKVNRDIADQIYLQRLIESGILVRLYLPFGTDDCAAPYCKRRLLSNPNLLIYGAKNLIGLS